MKNEIWKDVVGYEGIYQASNLGRIKSLDMKIVTSRCIEKRPGRILKQSLKKHGYLSLTLCRNKIKTDFRAHKVIAITFIPNPENKRTINHKNGIKTDNRVENLEWMTHKENIHHAIKYLR